MNERTEMLTKMIEIDTERTEIKTGMNEIMTEIIKNNDQTD